MFIDWGERQAHCTQLIMFPFDCSYALLPPTMRLWWMLGWAHSMNILCALCTGHWIPAPYVPLLVPLIPPPMVLYDPWELLIYRLC